jgi:shikimate kinase
MTARPNLILVGYMGAGKSSVGRLAAHRLGFQFIDTDALVVSRTGMEITDIFAQLGEAHFRDLETNAIESLMSLNRCVIATGGGAVLREKNRELLRALGYVVLLTASEDAIFDRVSRNSRRPLLRTENPRATIARMLEERRPSYEAAAHLIVDTTERSHEEAADAVIQAARTAFGW